VEHQHAPSRDGHLQWRKNNESSKWQYVICDTKFLHKELTWKVLDIITEISLRYESFNLWLNYGNNSIWYNVTVHFDYKSIMSLYGEQKKCFHYCLFTDGNNMSNKKEAHNVTYQNIFQNYLSSFLDHDIHFNVIRTTSWSYLTSTW